MGSLRVLLLGASMGAGHDAVSGELARRLRARGAATELCDVLTLLPPGTGPALRAFYRGTVRHAPALYAAIYALFLSPGDGHRPGSAPLAATARGRLLRRVRAFRPDLLVPTFHLAAQITGRLRAEGVLPVPASVFVTDFAVHRGWLHPGNDLYVCLTAQGAEAARAATGRPAAVSGPVVAPEFHRVAGPHPYAPEPGPPPVLLSTGAWGVGTRTVRTARLRRRARLPARPALRPGRAAATPGRPRPRRRRPRLDGRHGGAGWAPPGSSSTTPPGRPLFRPSPPVCPFSPGGRCPATAATGHGSMAAAGLSTYAHDPDDLLAGVRRLLRPGPVRTGQVEQGRAAFVADAAELLTRPLG
ncbi:Monogalactosyldiacylglycerol (MGDG) synthase [Streptomyces sp. IgraMP-1]|nr:Monogalactosyldiacylglycerol (MGDG) synthase [Streptomyces sp. IgraMP-1]